MIDLGLVLAIVALVLGAIEAIRTRGGALLAWAVLALAVAAIWPYIT